jgi:hypothetical protein
MSGERLSSFLTLPKTVKLNLIKELQIMKAELRIYGVAYYFTQPNADKGDYSFKDYDNEEISVLSDDVFIKTAEDNGNVWSLNAFLRETEAHNFGAKSATVTENMQFRAYLIDTENETNPPIRMDIEEYLMRVEDVGYSL